MTPRTFLRHYSLDARATRGDYYPAGPVSVEEGDTVGVVLLGRGGPQRLEDVQPFLYNLFMDPARVDLPVGGTLRHWISQGMASLREGSVAKAYEAIGGNSPLNRLSREQARGLEERLNETYGGPAGVTFRTYRAMRYGRPDSEKAARRMGQDGVDAVVLLPLRPQYSRCMTGSSLAYWRALEQEGVVPEWPVTAVREYAVNPKFLQALSERVDEALQRYPAEVRRHTRLVFSASGTSRREKHEHHDPYCCFVHATVQALMQRRDEDRPFEVTFRESVGLGDDLEPLTKTVVERLGRNGARSLLVVPVSMVTDYIETNHDLDIELREAAERAGVMHYEVASALNAHPLLIRALAESAVAQVDLPIDVNRLRAGSNGAAEAYPLCPYDQRSRVNGTGRSVRCVDCPHARQPRRWGGTAPDRRAGPAPGDTPREGEAPPSADPGSPAQSASSPSNASPPSS